METRGKALTEAAPDKLIFNWQRAHWKKGGSSAPHGLLPVVLELGGKDPMLVLE